MDDGLKLEYTEGIITTKLEIRSNSLDYDTNYAVQKWIDFCKAIFNHDNIKPDGGEGWAVKQLNDDQPFWDSDKKEK